LVSICYFFFIVVIIGFWCKFLCNPPLYVDVAAVVTGVSGEREYIRDGKVVKMVLLELTDNRFVACFNY
jgi:hypothetical protein